MQLQIHNNLLTELRRSQLGKHYGNKDRRVKFSGLRHYPQILPPANYLQIFIFHWCSCMI